MRDRRCLADIKARSPNPSPKPEIKTAAKATSVVRSMQESRVCRYRAHGDNGRASKSLFVTVAAPAGPAAPNDGAKMKAETFGRIGEDSPRDDCFQQCRCGFTGRRNNFRLMKRAPYNNQVALNCCRVELLVFRGSRLRRPLRCSGFCHRFCIIFFPFALKALLMLLKGCYPSPDIGAVDVQPLFRGKLLHGELSRRRR